MPVTIGGLASGWTYYDGLIDHATNRSNHIVQTRSNWHGNVIDGPTCHSSLPRRAQFSASSEWSCNAEETSAELTAIRTELGTIGAGDSASLAVEVEGLVNEIRTQRDQNKKFLDDITEAKCFIGRLEEKVAELLPLQEERGTLLESMKAKELSFISICAELDALKDNLREGKAALGERDAEIVRLGQQLAESESIASTAREACMEAQQRLDRSQGDVRDFGAEVVRLIDERTKALAMIEQLQRTSNEREHAIEVQVGLLYTELECSRAAFSSSEKVRQQEVAKLEAELSSLRDEHESLLETSQSEGALLSALHARIDELVAAQERIAAANSDQIASAEVERNKLASELRDHRAEYKETTRMAEQRISAALKVPTVPVASAQELNAAEVSADALTHNNFAESAYLSRLMAETLEIGGVRIGSPGGPSDSIAPATDPPSDLKDLILGDVRSAREALPISQELQGGSGGPRAGGTRFGRICLANHRRLARAPG